MSNLRATRVVLSILCLLEAGCSAGQNPGVASGAPLTTSVTRSGDETQVTVEEASAEPVNPVCLSYCEKTAACWHARSNPDLMLTKDEIVTRCRSEQADCHTPSTDMLCCSAIADCYDFNRCVAESRDKVTSCERVAPRRSF